MYKLALLVVMLMMAVASIGCQQGGLSEEEVRSIVQEEVARQLAGTQAKDIVAQEVTTQLASVDDIVTQEVTSQMAGVDDIVGQEVTRQIHSIDTLTLSELYIKNKDGNNVIMLGGSPYAGILIFNSEGKRTATLSTTSVGNGALNLYTSNEQPFASIDDIYGTASLYLYNRYGVVVALVGVDASTGNGFSYLNDRYGKVTFLAP